MMAMSHEHHSTVSTFFKFTQCFFIFAIVAFASATSIAGSATHAFRAFADPQPAANCFSE